jgi:hypothetical protein
MGKIVELAATFSLEYNVCRTERVGCPLRERFSGFLWQSKGLDHQRCHCRDPPRELAPQAHRCRRSRLCCQPVPPDSASSTPAKRPLGIRVQVIEQQWQTPALTRGSRLASANRASWISSLATTKPHSPGPIKVNKRNPARGVSLTASF